MTHVKFNSDEETYVSPRKITVHHNPEEVPLEEAIRSASRHDSMFHYFDFIYGDLVAEGGEEDNGKDGETVVGRFDHEIKDLLSRIIGCNDNTLVVDMDTPPSWHINRSETFTVNAAIDNTDWLFTELLHHHGHNTLFLRPGFNPQGRPGSKACRDGMWLDVYPLIQEVSEQTDIIMDALHNDLSHRDSMRVLTDPLTKVYNAGLTEKFDPDAAPVADGEEPDDRKYYGYSNWFIKAKYLSDSLHKVYPQNFRNIVIHGAAKLIAQDQLKITKLQQYLAACGRTGTRIILVD